MRQNIRKGWKIGWKTAKSPPTTQRWWSRAGAAMRGAMELGGENHENRVFFKGKNLRRGIKFVFIRTLGPKFHQFKYWVVL